MMKMNIKKIFSILIFMFFLISLVTNVNAYLFRTAAIDGPAFDDYGSYVFLTNCIISIGSDVKTNNPANFNVAADDVFSVLYQCQGYQADTDDYFFDSRLSTCSGTSCHLVYYHFSTVCTYSSTYHDWTCVVTDTSNGQWISFIYNKNDPTYGEVIRALNKLYEGECCECECTPGDTEQRPCGETDVGECEYGTETRVCQPDCHWGSWGTCMGAIYPTLEICDGSDNDCDGSIDEGLTRDCSNVCFDGDEICVLGNWVGCTADPVPYNYGESCSVGTGECEASGSINCYGECDAVPGEPSQEICDGLDNDCDGEIDEDLVCDICTSGDIETRQCGLTDVGECEYGEETRECVCGHYWTNWSECEGAIYPVEEICDQKDNDCDSLIDENGVCDECEDGDFQTKQCGTDIGECSYGAQTKYCVDGQWEEEWGPCIGAVYATQEICDEKDNDCDGLIDEDLSCSEDNEYKPKNLVSITRLGILNDDPLRPGDYLGALITFENIAGYDLKDLKLTIGIPELGAWKIFNFRDVKKGKEITKYVELMIPEDAKPGYYDLRVSISNDDFRRTKFREFVVSIINIHKYTYKW